MRDIAIQYKRISLGFDNYAFKPISVIEGYYDEDEKTFTTLNENKVYKRLDYVGKKSDLFFGNPINLAELSAQYNDELSSKEVIDKYINENYDSILLGKINDDNQMTIIVCNLANIGSYFDNNQKDTNNMFSLSKLREKVLTSIIGQDNAVKEVTAQLYKNYIVKDSELKSHILIAGPSGTGKTEMISIICKELNIPYHRVTATQFTQEGYHGNSVEDMITALVQKCDNDIELAEHSILIIDEIDKKASRGGDEQISTKGVLDSLLQILGKSVIQVNLGDLVNPILVDFDTSNLTVILMGAFEGILKTDNKLNLGFNSIEDDKAKKHIQLTKDDLIKYGLTKEFVGRINKFVAFNALTIEDLKRILINSDISSLRYEQKFINELGTELEVSEEYINAVAEKAFKMGLGARALKDVISDTFKDAEDELMLKNENEETKIKVLRMNKETVYDSKKYYVE